MPSLAPDASNFLSPKQDQESYPSSRVHIIQNIVVNTSEKEHVIFDHGINNRVRQ